MSIGARWLQTLGQIRIYFLDDIIAKMIFMKCRRFIYDV